MTISKNYILISDTRKKLRRPSGTVCFISITIICFISESSEVARVSNVINESPIFTPEQKETIKKNLKVDVESLEKHTAAAEAQRNKKPWVQSTDLSDSIARISRQKDAITVSLKKTISSFENINVSLEGREQNNLIMAIQSQASTELLDQPASCPDDDEYRTFDGSCNNVRHPSFGAAGIPMRRLAPPAYADGLYPATRILQPQHNLNYS